MDSVILLSVLSFSDGLNVLKEVGVSLIFVLFVLERFSPDLSGVFKLTAGLESTVPERMPTISVSRKLDMFIEENAVVNEKVFPFLFVLFKLEYNTQERDFSGSAFSNSKET